MDSLSGDVENVVSNSRWCWREIQSGGNLVAIILNYVHCYFELIIVIVTFVSESFGASLRWSGPGREWGAGTRRNMHLTIEPCARTLIWKWRLRFHIKRISTVCSGNELNTDCWIRDSKGVLIRSKAHIAAQNVDLISIYSMLYESNLRNKIFSMSSIKYWLFFNRILNIFTTWSHLFFSIHKKVSTLPKRHWAMLYSASCSRLLCTGMNQLSVDGSVVGAREN